MRLRSTGLVGDRSLLRSTPSLAVVGMLTGAGWDIVFCFGFRGVLRVSVLKIGVKANSKGRSLGHGRNHRSAVVG